MLYSAKGKRFASSLSLNVFLLDNGSICSMNPSPICSYLSPICSCLYLPAPYIYECLILTVFLVGYTLLTVGSCWPKLC